MVRDAITDGKRIGQLLASEIDGPDRGVLGSLDVLEADPDVEPATGGAFAYRIVAGGDERTDVGAAYVHPDRLRVEFETGVRTALDAAAEAGLRARPKATQPPRTLVFVESGADVKRSLRVFEAVLEDGPEQTG